MTPLEYDAVIAAIRSIGRLDSTTPEQYERIRNTFAYYLQGVEGFNVRRFDDLTKDPKDLRRWGDG